MFYKHKTHSLVITAIMVILLLFCTSCNDNDIEPDSQSYAYFEVFKTIAEEIAEYAESLEEEIKIEYIAVNLKNILHAHPSRIKTLIKSYADEHDVQIIWTNKDEYNSSKAGYLLIFEDVELTETELKTDVILWGSEVSASCDNYTVENKTDKWTITNRKPIWIH